MARSTEETRQRAMDQAVETGHRAWAAIYAARKRFTRAYVAQKRAEGKGKFAITNGGRFRTPENKFYGYADPKGTWSPTNLTPPSVVKALTNG